ncbi:RHS repeat-associated core domain-containing protein [Comamonas odontotermitis]|uniref:RHS repeat-associated core domain-containing protein n=1 Tax=Comamonas odontotermitis TaxID=379895 RepID=UPI00366FEE9B
MGEHHSAAKREDDGATPVAPAMLAVPLEFRKAPMAPAVRFGGSINPADTVRTKTYSTMELLSVGKSATVPTPVFVPGEAFVRNPAQGLGGTLGHASGGMIVGPNYAVPGQVVVKEVIEKSVQCLVQLKDELLKLFEQAKKAAEDPWQMGKDAAEGAYEGLKDELGGIWEALKQMPEVGGALWDLMKEIDAGEISIDDLVDGLTDMAGEMIGELICGYVQRTKDAAMAGGRAAAKEMGKLSAELIIKIATSVGTGGAGTAASVAGKAGAIGKKLGGIGEALKKRVRDRAHRRKNKPKPDDKPADKPAEHKPQTDERRPDNSAEKHGEAPSPCKTCPTAPAKGGGRRPVNPILGIKLLFDEDELDFQLPAPLPVVWQRFYSSDDTRVGLFGQGWVVPGALELEVRRQLTVLVDGQGRRIEFEAAAPGSEQWSSYEQIWLRRGGVDVLLQQIAEEHGEPDPYAQIPREWLNDPQRYFLRTPEGMVAVFAPPAFKPHGARVTPWPCVAVIDRNGYRVQYVHDEHNTLVAVIDSVGRVYRMAFTQVQPIRRSDNGVRLAGVLLAFDPMADLQGRTALSGPELSGLLRSALPGEDNTGAWLVRYRYQGGDLAEVIDALGQVRRSYGWRNHVMVEHRLPGGLVCQYEYDHYRPSGRVVREVVDGFELRFDYQDQATVLTDSLGRSTIYHFTGTPRGPAQRWTGITHADGSRETYEYSPFGQLIRVEDELGRETRYELDAQGRTIGIKAPDGAAARVQYDSATGEVASLTNPLGHARRWFHDAQGRLTEEVDEAGHATHYFYDEERLPDRPTRIRDAHGATKRLQWDAAGQLLAYTDCSGQTTRYGYDARGNLVAVTNAEGHTMRHQVDAAGRLLAVQHPDGAVERFGYDTQGRLIAHRNALGHDTHWRLNPLGQPLERVDALGHRLRYEYDAAGRLATLTNENNDAATFGYDLRDRLVQELGFDARRTEYRYNLAGELAERLEHGSAAHAAAAFTDFPAEQHLFNADTALASSSAPKRTAYVRDPAGRLLAQYSSPSHLPSSAAARAGITTRRQLTRYRYDAAGQVLQAASGDGARAQFEWDVRGLLVAEQATQPGLAESGPATQRIEHGYDGLGTRVYTVLPDGRRLNFLHYGSGHLHQVNLDGQVLTDIERDKLHRETSRSQGLLQSQYQYDSAGRLIGQRASAAPAAGEARTVIERQYRYDRAGQLQGLADKRWGMSAYVYDPLGRITAARHGDASEERFAFDPAHNLLDAARNEQARQQTQRRDERTDRQREEDEWADTVRRRLADPSFDVLGYQSESLPQRPPGCWAGNRLLVHEDQRFAWDRHGNLIAKKTGSHKAQYFAYDAQGQLTHVLTRTGLNAATAREQLVAFDYDALGRRVAKRVWPAQALRLQASPSSGEPAGLPAPSFAAPQGKQPSTSAYLWEGNRLLQEITPSSQRRTYVFEPYSFVPMLRIDEETNGHDLQKPERLPQAAQALEAKNTPNLADEEEEDDFAALKAQAWGRMAGSQRSAHLEQLRQQAEQLRLPAKASQPKAARILHYHCDHLGTPRELTDEDGKLVWSAEYLAWGKLKRLQGRMGGSTQANNGSTPPDQFWHTRTQPGRANHLPEWVADNAGNVQQWRQVQEAEHPEAMAAANDPQAWGELTDQSIRFQGQWHDVETGLHYNRFRYYDPEVGRFIHQDPIGLDGGNNLYQYAPNPLNWLDPLGLARYVIIGENQSAVEAYAAVMRKKRPCDEFKTIAPDWRKISGRAMTESGDFKMGKAWEEKAVAKNAAWIRDRAKDGYAFIDLGLDDAANRSPFYAAEKTALSRTNAKVFKPNRCGAAEARDQSTPSDRPAAKGRYGKRRR